MSKVSNALSLLKILESGKIYKIKELAELLECSERSIRTYKEDLEKTGIFIESVSGRYGGYYYICNKKNDYFGMDKKDLNILEKIYLYLCDNKYNDIESLSIILDKIRYSLINNPTNSIETKLVNNSLYIIIMEAINNNKNISFIYKKKKYQFIPQNISVYSGNCFVTGINKELNEIRTYNLQDIKKIEII